jgi:hypothetical protein
MHSDLSVCDQINLVEELEMSMSCMSDSEYDIIASVDHRRVSKMVHAFMTPIIPNYSNKMFPLSWKFIAYI